MNRIKRWTSALVLRVDQMMAQVENHEALADSVIRDVRRAAARAKVQLGRVQADGEGMRRRLAELEQAESRWRERARECAESDEDRALECLRRSRRAAGSLPELARRLAEHLRTEKLLSADVAKVEQRLEQLQLQRNLMRTRQSRAEALSGARAAESVGAGELGEIFEHWDTRITELELDGGVDTDVDSLELEYADAEERDELLAELAELRQR